MVAVAIVAILAAVLAGVYFGEWPWVWDPMGAAGSLLEHLSGSFGGPQSQPARLKPR